jgi:DNA-binding transcriptional LysR family regulator
MPQNLNLDLARTFVTIADTGSFSEAATKLNLALPTVSLQMKRLEDALGQDLFIKNDRGRELSRSGHVILGFARKLLQINDVAVTELASSPLIGRVRIGTTEEFANDRLPDVLREFRSVNPAARVDLIIDVNQNLHAALKRREIDVALVAQDPISPRPGTFLFREELIWIGSSDLQIRRDEPIPLILFNEPCIVRDIIIRALEAARRPYEIVCTSQSLSGIQAAARASLGITARTRAQLEPGLRAIDLPRFLPRLPQLQLCGFMRDGLMSGDQLALKINRLLIETFSGSRFRMMPH